MTNLNQTLVKIAQAGWLTMRQKENLYAIGEPVQLSIEGARIRVDDLKWWRGIVLDYNLDWRSYLVLWNGKKAYWEKEVFLVRA